MLMCFYYALHHINELLDCSVEILILERGLQYADEHELERVRVKVTRACACAGEHARVRGR